MIKNNDKKIRIGYILKSAEVRTLVSRRYSENSSRTNLCKMTSTRIHLNILTYTCALPHTPKYTHAYQSTPLHTFAHQHPPAHTHTNPHIPVHTPHRTTHAHNLINHMILYINKPNTKTGEEEEEDRKRKEQESLKHFSRLKMLLARWPSIWCRKVNDNLLGRYISKIQSRKIQL